MFTYEIADIAHEKANDDLYTLNVKLTDLAGNKVEKTFKYSLNRFGSIFVLSDATKAMVDNYYVTSPQDVVITEINVDSLTYKEVSVAHDGNVKNVEEGRGYQVSDLTNNNGWHSISYTVNASNFNKDGIYSAEEDQAQSDDQAVYDRYLQTDLKSVAHPAVLPGSEILAAEGGSGSRDGVKRAHGKALDPADCGQRRDVDAAQAVVGSLQHHASDGRDGELHSHRKAHQQELFFQSRVRLHLILLKMKNVILQKDRERAQDP